MSRARARLLDPFGAAETPVLDEQPDMQSMDCPGCPGQIRKLEVTVARGGRWLSEPMRARSPSDHAHAPAYARV
jgi:hypothetical protein